MRLAILLLLASSVGMLICRHAGAVARKRGEAFLNARNLFGRPRWRARRNNTRGHRLAALLAISPTLEKR